MFHNQDEQTLYTSLEVNPATGLTAAQVAERQQKHGLNALTEAKKISMAARFLNQFKDFMILILLAAAVISYFVSGDLVDSVVILVVVLVNAILGVTQESKAERSLEALKKMAAPHAKVLRDGKRDIIAAQDLVPGDIIFVEAGDLVPADARIIDCGNLKVEESALTGESVPVDKTADLIAGEDIPLGDRINMMFSSTIVTYGRATAVVTATGMDSQCGKIAGALAGEKEEQTPLQKRLSQIGTFLGLLALVICLAIFALGMFQGTPFAEIFMTAVTLAVAAIPEGLPAIVTVVLAMGVQRLVKKNAIIRKLPAVETLGSASVICSDKTGTLTLNQMTVTNIYTNGVLLPLDPADKAETEKVLTLAVLCNDGEVEPQPEGGLKHIGDPTETAMVAALYDFGVKKSDLTARYPRVAEIPFDSDRKLMTTVHQAGDRWLSITKGAPDQVLARCVGADFEGIMAANKAMADQALRVLAVAIRELDVAPDAAGATSEALEQSLTFVGLMGMIDPPRQEAKEAVMVCQEAGITPVMITGDHKDTAVAIARELGILVPGSEAISGSELDLMSDDELFANIERYRVYARVSPDHKIRIVKAWKRHGKVVAMTGDGVNDAPALKAADIGCAMGITGTEVAKGAADMILTDDNFATITEAVREGRGIYQNIKKCITFLLSGNLGEVLTIFIAMAAGLGSPLLPTQILWVNLITDSLPALALGVEPVEDDIMSRSPLPRDEGFFTKGTILHVVLMGIMVSALSLSAYGLGKYWLPTHNPDLGHTMAFMVLAFSQLFHAFNMKSERSLFKVGVFSNRSLVLSLVVGIVLQLALYFIPFLAGIFSLAHLEPIHWLWVAGLSLAPIPVVELGKVIRGLLFPRK